MRAALHWLRSGVLIVGLVILYKSLIMRGLGLGSEIPDNLSTFIIANSIAFRGN